LTRNSSRLPPHPCHLPSREGRGPTVAFASRPCLAVQAFPPSVHPGMALASGRRTYGSGQRDGLQTAGRPQFAARGVAGLGGCLLALAQTALLLYREQPSDPSSTESMTAPTDRCAVRGNRRLWPLVGAGYLYGGAQCTFTAYLALFPQEHWELPLPLAGGLLGECSLGGPLHARTSRTLSRRCVKSGKDSCIRGDELC
jgi:hypothetical protein